ncbi:RNA-binding (RRM/RBD/RNP motifs) family protein [Wolffia australiana]
MAGHPSQFAVPGVHQWQIPPASWHSDSQAYSATPPSSTGLVTVLVRHLPEAIPQEVLSRLFSFYGAASVRPCVGGRLRNCAFVDFGNEVLASQAQSQLHRLKFMGKVLSVERASKARSDDNKLKTEAQSSVHSSILKAQALMEKKTKGAEMPSTPLAEPIAPRLGVDFPFPPYLEYEYPPPDGNILTNIVNALIAVPRFYTQVLHLMNKMNIPAPFRMALPTPPIPPSAPPQPPPPPPISESHLAYLSDEESEQESEEEASGANQRRKRVKRETIVGPAINRGVSHEDVGLKAVSLVPKEVPIIKKKNPVLKFNIPPKSVPKESKAVEGTLPSSPEPERQPESKSYVAAEEIERGKLPPEELLSLPMFKNYTPGNPAAVLYVKNLAKDVIVDDFYFIFGSLFGGADEAKSALGVKLMQEGRMRGQAFVTFPNVDLAQHALNLVNGFVFKGKPMVIQFGRNPSTAKPRLNEEAGTSLLIGP